MKEKGRQVNTARLYVVTRKQAGRATGAFLDATKNEIAYRWLQRGQSTREISRGLRINDREAVEAAVREAVAPAPRPFVMAGRKAA